MVREILESIITYGIIPVALAVAISFIILAFKKISDNNKEQIEYNEKQLEFNQSQSELLANILSAMVSVKKDTNHGHSHEEEEENRRINILINQQLQRLLLHTNANRVCCFLYHNGGYAVTGRSFQKMSIMFEQIDKNTVSVMSDYQNVPRMLYSILFQKITEQGYYYIEDMKDIEKIDAVTCQSFKTRGTKAAFIRGIIDANKTVLGFITVEFSTNECKDLEDLKSHLLNKTLMISGLLQGNSSEPTKIKNRGD